MNKPIRVLVAKPGLDGHDRGAKVIARALRDAGMEVIYTGLRQTPEMIVNAALQEDAQVIGLSILSGAHNAIVPRVMELLREKDMTDTLVVVGGIVPDQDAEALKAQGVAAVFQPGASLDGIVEFIRSSVAQKVQDSRKEQSMEDKLKIAVVIDFDNSKIGVKSTLQREFDVAAVLDALKERGEIVTKIAYANWGRQDSSTRQMAEHAVQMVQRDPSPRGDKNGADINLALDALELAFTHDHINAFAIVSGDSDFIALVNKLKQYNKLIFVVGGKAFTSTILQKNCHEFISYESLLLDTGRGGAPRPQQHSREQRSGPQQQQHRRPAPLE